MVARCGQCAVGRSQLLRRHRQREQRSKKHAPCAPSIALEERTKDLGVIERAQDVHRASFDVVSFDVDLTRVRERIRGVTSRARRCKPTASSKAAQVV